MVSKFEARTAYNLDVDICNDPICQTWDLSKLSSEAGSLFWREDEDTFQLKINGPSDGQATIVKLSFESRIAILDDEAWLLGESVTNLPIWVNDFIVHESGLLLWNLNEAMWVDLRDVWNIGNLASDDLSFSKITTDGIAIGSGYNTSDLPMSYVILSEITCENQSRTQVDRKSVV